MVVFRLMLAEIPSNWTNWRSCTRLKMNGLYKLTYIWLLKNTFHGLSPSGSHHSLLFDQRFQKSLDGTDQSAIWRRSKCHLMVLCIDEIVPSHVDVQLKILWEWTWSFLAKFLEWIYVLLFHLAQHFSFENVSNVKIQLHDICIGRLWLRIASKDRTLATKQMQDWACSVYTANIYCKNIISSVSNGTGQCSFWGQRDRSSFIVPRQRDNGISSKSCQGTRPGQPIKIWDGTWDGRVQDL